MNSTAAAIVIIVLAALILACMAGIGGFVVGRAHTGALNSKEASGETIPAGLLDDLQEVSGLLEFTQEMMFEYRSLALESASDPEKLQNADARVLRKLKEIEGVLERKG